MPTISSNYAGIRFRATEQAQQAKPQTQTVANKPKTTES